MSDDGGSTSASYSLPGSLDKLFTRAIALEGRERERFIAEVAAVKPAMAARLAALLAADAMQDSGSGIRGEDELITVRTSAGVGGDAGILTGRRIGGFEVGELIGQGGSGAVYQARQTRPARTVAFKALRPEVAGPKARRRFELEAEHLALLAHPNIATVIAAGFDEEVRVSWMATEFVEGAKSIVRRAVDGGLTLPERLELMRAACDAVASAHAKGVLHRDLKPSNILVGADGVVKVIDFGLARALSTADGRSLATETGEIVGTLLYMSPEQCSGDPRAIDTRSDVFALGAVLYELLTDQPPRQFDGTPLPAAIRAVGERDIEAPSRARPELAGDIDAVVAMACALDPQSRYASVRDFSEDLARVIAGEPVQARAPGALRKLRSWVRREPRLAGAVSVAGLATVGLFVAALVYGNEKRDEARRAGEISRHVYDRLVPAASKLGATQDAPYIREIDAAAYDLSVMVNGSDHEVTANLALELAIDWLEGPGYDPVEAARWALEAERAALAASNLGPGCTTAVEAKCVQARALALRANQAREGGAELKRAAKSMLESVIPLTEDRNDVDLASHCLGILGDYAESDRDNERASEYYRRAVARSVRIKGESDEDVVRARGYLVESLGRQERWNEMLVELDALLLVQREHERGLSPFTIRLAMQRGEALLRLGRFGESERQLVEADALVRDRMGPNHGMRNHVRAYLRAALTAQGRGDEAAREWQDVELARQRTPMRLLAAATLPRCD